jgi:hypothetical protein
MMAAVRRRDFEWAILVTGLGVYARGMARRNEGPASAGEKGRKPPFEVLFAVWALLAAIVGFDILGVLAILEMLREPEPTWVIWLSGFILLLLSVIGVSFVQSLRDGDQNMRYYVSYSVLLCGFGFSWPPSWRWLLFLVPVILIVPSGCHELVASLMRPRIIPQRSLLVRKRLGLSRNEDRDLPGSLTLLRRRTRLSMAKEPKMGCRLAIVNPPA